MIHLLTGRNLKRVQDYSALYVALSLRPGITAAEFVLWRTLSTEANYDQHFPLLSDFNCWVALRCALPYYQRFLYCSHWYLSSFCFILTLDPPTLGRSYTCSCYFAIGVGSKLFGLAVSLTVLIKSVIVFCSILLMYSHARNLLPHARDAVRSLEAEPSDRSSMARAQYPQRTSGFHLQLEDFDSEFIYYQSGSER